MKHLITLFLLGLIFQFSHAQNTFPSSGNVGIGKTANLRSELDVNGNISSNTNFISQVVFPVGSNVGDYIEFVKVMPANAGSSGFYEVSISYTRENIAAGATFIGSISHNSQASWRELGRINSNGYLSGSAGHNFTVDCNIEYGNVRFRIRAINTLGNTSQSQTVHVKVRSISQNLGWSPLNVTGNDLTVNKFLPMTNDWTLLVGNTRDATGAITAIKALQNGNVGIGTTTPTDKLSVKGKIRAQEIKVELTGWADYVFAKDYKLPTLEETEAHIKEKGLLSGIPSAAEVAKSGIELGEMNKKLLQKIEELTLYLIEMKKENIKQLTEQQKESNLQKAQLRKQNEKISAQNINIRKLSEQLNKIQINQTKKTE